MFDRKKGVNTQTHTHFVIKSSKAPARRLARKVITILVFRPQNTQTFKAELWKYLVEQKMISDIRTMSVLVFYCDSANKIKHRYSDWLRLSCDLCGLARWYDLKMYQIFWATINSLSNNKNWSSIQSILQNSLFTTAIIVLKFICWDKRNVASQWKW